MTPTASATVADDRVTLTALPPAALIAFDIWGDIGPVSERVAAALGGKLPPLAGSGDLPGAWRAIRVEPTVWWLTGPLDMAEAVVAVLETVLEEDGGVTELSGGFTRIGVRGPSWRELLMIGGIFDAESAAFGAGSTAGTLLHHVGVRYDVVRDDEVHIHLGPSYGGDLLHHLSAAASRLDLPER